MAANPYLAIAEEEPKTDPSAIYLDDDAQSQAGLEIVELKPVSQPAEFMATGKAVNLQALLALRNRYLLNLTEQRSNKAKLEHTNQDAKRMQDLYQHGVAAKRNVQAQQSQLQADQAQLDAGAIQNQAIIDETRLGWGQTLSTWALATNPKHLQAFLSGQQTLILLSLPIGRIAPEQLREIYLDAAGNRSKAQVASFVSAAPQPESSQQAEYYYFETNGIHIKPGMRVSAWIPENQHHNGVSIPKSALIWHMGEAFVYLKTKADTFTRLAITDYSPTAEGYFVSSGLQAGQYLVSSGAQLLLSEEIRGQIPDD